MPPEAKTEPKSDVKQPELKPAEPTASAEVDEVVHDSPMPVLDPLAKPKPAIKRHVQEVVDTERIERALPYKTFLVRAVINSSERKLQPLEVKALDESEAFGKFISHYRLDASKFTLEAKLVRE